MTLEEFAKYLHQDILVNSEDSLNYAVDNFTDKSIEAMTDAGEADGAIGCNCRKRGYKINAFNLSADGDCIDLFVTLYTNQDPPAKVIKSEVERHFAWLQSFFSRCLSGKFRVGLEESSPEFDAAHSIYTSKDLLTRGRLFFVTDGITSAADYEDIKVNGVRFTHHVWDIERLFRLETSGAEREKIDIWFERDFGGAVPLISIAGASTEYTTFLGFFPAELLVNIYQRYGARLLERNVRSFLQARGKINRGIRDTILNEPKRFLAYNNGISVTAEQLDVRNGNEGIIRITRAQGFQIVNGGQTTASLYAAVKKDKADVKGIFIQVKLTVPQDAGAIDELAPKISLYANSQNKVNTADFSANHPFHLKVEELSRTIWAPAASGSQLETRWYYERARGSYLDDLGRAKTAADQRKWKIQNPTAQKFTKTDMAKFEHTWDQLPHLVSRGAEKNFVEFMARLSERQQSHLPDDAFFRRLVAKAILFRQTEKIVHSQKYGGYRANIVTYSIAWLSHQTGQRLDLVRIWRNQALPSELEESIRTVSKAAYDHLVQGAKGGNVTEWAKREACWDEFKKMTIPNIPSLAIDSQSFDTQKADTYIHQNAISADALAPELRELLAVDAESWLALSHWAKETNNLTAWQRSLSYSLGRLAHKGSMPSVKQLKQGLLIIQEAKRLGFRPAETSASQSSHMDAEPADVSR
jgi:hypothetical protein